MKGNIPEKMLSQVLDSLPLEITLTDANDRIIAWTHARNHIFDRPDSILGQDVRKCHPPKSHARIDRLLGDMKSGKIDSEVTVIERLRPDRTPGRVEIVYMALRDKGGKYLGCLEICRHLD